MLRLFADAFLAVGFLAGLDGVSYFEPDLEGALDFLLLGALFCFCAWLYEPEGRKRAPRALHGVLGALLVVMLLAIALVFFGGGVVDPSDLWIVGWLLALAALAFYRAFHKKK